MINLFISQPMRDRTRDEIMAERERLAAKMRETLREDVSVIESFFDKPDREAAYRWRRLTSPYSLRDGKVQGDAG